MSKPLKKSNRIALGLAIAVSGALLAPMAQASTVNLKSEGASVWGSGSNVWARNVSYKLNGASKSHGAGLFRLEETATGKSVLAWCIDLLHVLTLPADHDTEVASANAAQLGNIDKLFTSSYGEVDSADEAAGFQMALWEIMTDTGSADGLDLTKGGFQTTGSATPYTLAADYLGRLGTAGTGGYKLTTYYNATSQNLVSATPVPLPAAGLLLLGGLFGVGAMRSRRRKA
ncbi:MAG: hypothetical protein WBB25_11395 [Sulfitobacter sp.]